MYEYLVCVVRHTVATTSPLITLKLELKVSTSGYWNRAATDHLEKYRRVLNEMVDVTSNNRGFRTINQSVATFEQVKSVLLLPAANGRD